MFPFETALISHQASFVWNDDALNWFNMLTLKNEEAQQNDTSKEVNLKTSMELSEYEQLDIFSDIIISILLKRKLHNEPDEK